MGIAYTEVWWPGIMLVIGLPLALRQYFLGRIHDTLVTLLVFVGTFITIQFDISWRVFLPIIFTTSAIYIVVREYLESNAESEEEIEEDTNLEIKERKKINGRDRLRRIAIEFESLIARLIEVGRIYEDYTLDLRSLI